ncbi:putative multicopper oxidase [Hypoxylon fragiforme]|uniref:putative multicopper oxidase n=1 Tax=Hypoxylon fragiforme TaxID=63214 RepID=UPI0020C73F30|nr:putative multicopper oxidase [Hypoxylon fragiforme]KAI2609436.1 putative multicopper oxidase [Hypoxylon fragiforme]
MLGHRSSSSASGLMLLDGENSPQQDLSWPSEPWESTSDLPFIATEKRPQRTIPLRLFFISLLGFCIIALALGLGLGLGLPRYKTVYAAPPLNYNALYGIPEDLPFVSIDRLINETELSLQTKFEVSREPMVRDYVFDVSQAYAAPDGFRKPMVLVNGQSPGPLIEANVGDTVRVRVNNKMANQSTTIHWHGINQRGSTWMDGVAGISQCGIPPGRSFTYEFRVQDQRGTFWWHAHSSVQYSDGAYGAIIIHDPDEMVPETDDEKIIFVSDVYHAYGPVILKSYLNPTSKWAPTESGVEPLADNILLNGQSPYNCSINSTTYPPSSSPSSTHPFPSTTDCTANDNGRLSSTAVRAGQTTRLRLINASSFFSYWFSIDNHTLTIVELDGVEIEPLRAQGVYLNLGQRASVVVAADQEPGGYYIRATLPRTCFLPYSTYTSKGLEGGGYEGRGVLRYVEEGHNDDEEGNAGKTIAEPIGSPRNTTNPYGVESNGLRGDVWEGCDDMPFDMAVPMRREPAVDVSEVNTHYIEYAFRQAQDVNRIFINKTSYSPLPHNATLWKALDQKFTPDRVNAYSSWDFGLSQQVLLIPDAEQGAQIVINSRDAMEHPWHLHGHTFQIVAWGPGLFGDSSNTTRTTWHLTNPMRRDTVTIPPFSHVVIRFPADNPGLWALHCHVAWHIEGGMFLSLAELPSDLVDLVDAMDPETRRQSQGFCGVEAGDDGP